MEKTGPQCTYTRIVPCGSHYWAGMDPSYGSTFGFLALKEKEKQLRQKVAKREAGRGSGLRVKVESPQDMWGGGGG